MNKIIYLYLFENQYLLQLITSAQLAPKMNILVLFLLLPFLDSFPSPLQLLFLTPGIEGGEREVLR